MNGLLLTHRGLEELAVDELHDLEITSTATPHAAVEFIGTQEDFVRAIHQSRLSTRILERLHVITITEQGERAITTFCQSLPTIHKQITEPFRVTCERHGKHEFTSTEVEQAVGKALPIKQPVSLNNPSIIIYVYIYETYWCLGIDLCGSDLSKRPYKILHNKTSIKGSIASGLLRLAKYNRTKTLFDPFCGDGTIVIEAALQGTNTTTHPHARFAYQKLGWQAPIIEKHEKINKLYCTDKEFRNIAAAKKNAKIAGVDKHITFARKDLNTIDLKADSHSIDCIVCTLHVKQTSTINTLRIQAHRLLKEDGILCVLTNKPEVFHDFEIIHTCAVTTGKKTMHAVVMRRPHEM